MCLAFAFVEVEHVAPDEERLVLSKPVVQFSFTYGVSRGIFIFVYTSITSFFISGLSNSNSGQVSLTKIVLLSYVCALDCPKMDSSILSRVLPDMCGDPHQLRRGKRERYQY